MPARKERRSDVLLALLGALLLLVGLVGVIAACGLLVYLLPGPIELLVLSPFILGFGLLAGIGGILMRVAQY